MGFLGPVLTNVRNVARLRTYLQRGKFDAVKVVGGPKGWGVDEGGWNEANIRAVLGATVNPIVRTPDGDPSNRNASWFLDPEAVATGLRPWLAVKPDCWVEIGNEPDVRWEQKERDDFDIWVYAWWLEQTINRLRSEFPKARIIGPSPRIGTSGWYRWLEIPAAQLRRCDAVSLHLYGWHTIRNDGKGELVAAEPAYKSLFGEKPVWVTELGVNHPPMPAREKLKIYREFAARMPKHWLGATFFHLNERRDSYPEYCVGEGDL